MGEHRGDPPATAEHAAAVADARAALAGSSGQPLGPLPAGFAATRAAMHRVAEEVLKPRREAETGNEIALRFTSGGFGTPPWETGLVSGRSGQLRVEGLELVATDGDELHRERLADPGPTRTQLRRSPPGSPSGRWPSPTWSTSMATSSRRRSGSGPSISTSPPTSDPRTSAPARPSAPPPATSTIPSPTCTSAPWAAPATDAGWNATGFNGAELTYAELLGADDQLGAAAAFFADRLAALRG